MNNIPANLKKGDTFEDGGRWFKVLKVLEDGNYSSKYLGNKKPPGRKPTEKE